MSSIALITQLVHQTQRGRRTTNGRSDPDNAGGGMGDRFSVDRPTMLHSRRRGLLTGWGHRAVD
jgi:hypothetical protein